MPTDSREPIPPDRPTRHRLTGEERQQKILEAARAVFSQQGLEGARTRQIADLAETSEAMIYRYYRSKEELFEASVFGPLDQIIADMVRTADGFSGKSARDRLEESVEFHSQLLTAMIELWPLLGVALFSTSGAGRDLFVSRLQPILDLYVRATERALQGWDHVAIEPELLARLMLGMHLGLAMDADVRGVDVQPDRIAVEIANFVARGLGAAPPKRTGPGQKEGRKE
jgi:AcrR family transcriptional regulator